MEETDPDTGAKFYQINPVFEEHVRDLKNWTVTGLEAKFWQTFPLLAKAVEESRQEFGGLGGR